MREKGLEQRETQRDYTSLTVIWSRPIDGRRGRRSINNTRLKDAELRLGTGLRNQIQSVPVVSGDVTSRMWENRVL